MLTVEVVFTRGEREAFLVHDSVRQHYVELQSGVQECLPTDLGRPLAVGQLSQPVIPKPWNFVMAMFLLLTVIVAGFNLIGWS
jgi:hypothetical protein